MLRALLQCDTCPLFMLVILNLSEILAIVSDFCLSWSVLTRGADKSAIIWFTSLIIDSSVLVESALSVSVDKS